MSRHRVVLKLSLLSAILFPLGIQSSIDADVVFPRNQRSWLNSEPLSMDAMKGKAAFLWFFEEG